MVVRVKDRIGRLRNKQTRFEFGKARLDVSTGGLIAVDFFPSVGPFFLVVISAFPTVVGSPVREESLLNALQGKTYGPGI